MTSAAIGSRTCRLGATVPARDTEFADAQEPQPYEPARARAPSGRARVRARGDSSLVRDQRVRLVTLTGPGGTGKTSLAIAAAAALLDAFEHGVWLVDLAPVADAGLVESTIAAALGSATRMRANICATEMRLLVLDNFEQCGRRRRGGRRNPGRLSRACGARDQPRAAALRGEREFPLVAARGSGRVALSRPRRRGDARLRGRSFAAA